MGESTSEPDVKELELIEEDWGPMRLLGELNECGALVSDGVLSNCPIAGGTLLSYLGESCTPAVS